MAALFRKVLICWNIEHKMNLERMVCCESANLKVWITQPSRMTNHWGNRINVQTFFKLSYARQFAFSFYCHRRKHRARGVIHFYGQIVEPACDVSTQSSPVEMNCPQNGSVPGKTYSSKALMSGNVKNAQIASVKVQYLDKQKKLAVMNIEYN